MYITALFSVTVPTLVGKAFFMNFHIAYFGGNDLWQIITYEYHFVIFCHSAYFGGNDLWQIITNVYHCVIFCHSAYFDGKAIFSEYSDCLNAFPTKVGTVTENNAVICML